MRLRWEAGGCWRQSMGGSWDGLNRTNQNTRANTRPRVAISPTITVRSGRGFMGWETLWDSDLLGAQALQPLG